MSAQDCGRRRLHAAPPAASSARSAGGGFYLGDHLAGESGDLRGLLGTLPAQAPHDLGYGGVAHKIACAGFAAGVAQGGDQLLPPGVRTLRAASAGATWLAAPGTVAGSIGRGLRGTQETDFCYASAAK